MPPKQPKTPRVGEAADDGDQHGVISDDDMQVALGVSADGGVLMHFKAEIQDDIQKSISVKMDNLMGKLGARMALMQDRTGKVERGVRELVHASKEQGKREAARRHYRETQPAHRRGRQLRQQRAPARRTPASVASGTPRMASDESKKHRRRAHCVDVLRRASFA